MYGMNWVRKGLRVRSGRRRTWIAAISAILLAGLILGILTQAPEGNPIQQALNPPVATAITTSPATALPTSKPLTADEILVRSRSAHFQDMRGSETIIYGDGGSTRGTIILTSSPARSEDVASQFDAQGHLIELDDEIRDGTKRYQHIISYRTNPPTDNGWKLDPQPLPDPRLLSAYLLDPFTGAATLVGTEAINGVSTYHLQVQPSTTSKMEAWIRTDNFYFAQWKEIDSFSQALITMTAWDSGLTGTVPSV
jgi:hypothetical protein